MRLLILLILTWSMLSGTAMAVEEKIIYGYVEKATLVDKNLSLSAKLDTGAKSASLSAINIQEIRKNNRTYLRFLVPTKQGNVEFTSEYLGKVRIKLRSGEKIHLENTATSLKRPVVMMRIKIGDKIRDIPVNLTNRKRFIYPLLLGRDAIKAFSGLVDPSAAFTIRVEKGEKT